MRLANIENDLIIVKGQDKTAEIRSWRYENSKVLITFSNGQTYPYSHNNVSFFKKPTVVSPKRTMIFFNGKPLYNMKNAQIFEKHIRVFDSSGKHKLFDKKDLQLIQSSLIEPNVKKCFEYLKKLSHAIGLKHEDGESILGKSYDKITFLREDTISSAFLRGELPLTPQETHSTPIFPFGFNSSQKIAVEQALCNKLSVIEGPPGTGKTQTILNIIANAIMSGKSVAVVANNNFATANVLEKLKKNDLDFIAAYLGNADNRVAFIENQPSLPDLSGWKLPEENKNRLNHMQLLFSSLNDMMEKKISLSKLQQELDDVEKESKHFIKYCEESYNNIRPLKSFRKITAKKALKLLSLFELYAEKGINAGRLVKFKNFLLFGLSDKAFYDMPYEQMITVCQKHYYSQRIAELQKSISALSNALSKYSFDEKIKEYSDMSMELFRNYLSIKYQEHSRKKYVLTDLKKNSGEFIFDFPVVLSSTHSLHLSLSNQHVYDYVIIDEASQVDLTAGFLTLSCAKNAVIAGDLNQLPNIVDETNRTISDEIFSQYLLPEAYRFSNHSLLRSIVELFPSIPKTLLREHYRCHPTIIGFCNQKFYDNQLIVLTQPKSERMPLVVYRTAPGNHARNHLNLRQIEVIQKEVIPQQRLDPAQTSIGITTPYCNQSDALQQAFANTGIKAATIDKFQGQENDVIILSTVDNEITEFAAKDDRINVAVSRAIEQLIVIVNGNEDTRDTNIKDLINYIQYNNLDIVESNIYSVFDYLFKAYSIEREALLKKHKKISEYDSENLMYALIKSTLAQDCFSKYDVVTHIPLKEIFRKLDKLTEDEVKYAMNICTHVDFLVFNKLGRIPVLAVEVDGVSFHQVDSLQSKRDQLKDSIFSKYELPLLRFRTNGSEERHRLEAALRNLKI